MLRVTRVGSAVFTITIAIAILIIGSRASAQAVSGGYRDAHRLGGSTSFHKPPLTNAAAVKRMTAARGVAADIRKVWLQQGAESPAVLEVCKELGLETVSRECILMYTRPSGVHRFHRWIHDTFTPHAPAA